MRGSTIQQRLDNIEQEAWYEDFMIFLRRKCPSLHNDDERHKCLMGILRRVMEEDGLEEQVVEELSINLIVVESNEETSSQEQSRTDETKTDGKSLYFEVSCDCFD